MRRVLLLVLLLLTIAGFTSKVTSAEQAAADPSTLIAADQFAKWDKEHVRTTFDILQDDDPRGQNHGKKLNKKVFATPAAEAMDGRKVSIRGYMIPVDLDDKGVSMFILAPHLDTCCFGTVGQPNQMVLVVMARKTAYARQDQVTVFGKFHINDISNAGEFSAQSLYQLDGVAMAVHTAAFEKAVGSRP